MKTFASLFSGFDGVGIGAKAAGLELAWGVEYDAAIAEVGNFNLGNHIKVANILDCNPMNFERVDVLHASPVCTNFSVAKTDGKESALDIACAKKTAEFVTILQPEIFTLENVMAYRKSKSLRHILLSLHKNKYSFDYWHLNTADYGVPQTRQRLILVARRGKHKISKPISTHDDSSKNDPLQTSMFDTMPLWISWYTAIEDLIPTLPETQFAPWQSARLPEELRTMLVAQGKYGDNLVTTLHDKPSFTITANSNQTGVRALLFTNTGGAESFGDHHVWADDPAGTVTAQSLGRARAFIVDCQNAGNPSPDRKRSMTIRSAAQPMFTVTSSMMPKRPCRAFDGGRVVAMTPRCLARFQSFPDWYQLPDSKTLAAKGIGNAVCPLMMEKIYGGLLS
jgi:DNA (cytosine-5)-methyltransferase 1